MGEAEEFWDNRYGERDRIWSGRPNASMVAAVVSLTPGRVLDLGCGEGGDSIWLAEQGWTVTGLDVSATALARAAEEADARGLAIDWVRADLSTWEPEGTYDLVSACFLHSPIAFPRTEVLRRLAGSIAPGGHLLVVGHAAPPPWSRYAEDHDDHDGHGDHDPATTHRFLTAEEELAELALGPDWTPVTVAMHEREATGPDGERATLEDSVVLLRRAG
jgi:SAM-dependent methyltransferase